MGYYCKNPCTASIEEVAETGLSVYPNPVSHFLTIDFSELLTHYNIRFYNLAGQIVITKTNLKGNSFTIDVSSLTKGIYIVELVSGNEVKRLKVIKE